MSHTITRERSGLAELAKAITAVNAAVVKINTVLSKPRITRLDPTTHVEKQAFTLEVYGEHFTDKSVVGVTNKDGSPYVRATTFRDAGHLSAEVDAGYEAGNGKVYVRTGVDTDALYSDEWPFKFTAATKRPVINRLDPDTQRADESFILAIIGANFNGDAKVLLGLNNEVGSAQEQKTAWKSSTRLEIQGGRFTEGTYYVWVREAAGTAGPATLTITAKKKPAPHIDSISPASSVERERFHISIDGHNFESGAKAQLFDGHGWTSDAEKTDVQNERMITAWFGSGYHAAQIGVRVVNPDGQKSNDKPFTLTSSLPAPTLRYIDPTRCEAHKPFTLDVYGGNFVDDDSTINIDGSDRQTKYHTSSRLSFHEAEGFWPGARDVYVRNKDNRHSEKATLDIYKKPEKPPKPPRPVINELDPASHPVAEEFTLTVRGDSFVDGAKVFLQTTASAEGHPSATTFMDTRTLKADIKEGLFLAQSLGAYVWVKNPDGQESAPAEFHFTPAPAPYISSLSPNPTKPWELVTASGGNLKDGHMVWGFGGEWVDYRGVSQNLPTSFTFEVQPQWTGNTIGIKWKNSDGVLSNEMPLTVY